MGLFGLIFFLVTCVLIGAGIAIGVFASVLAAAFVALGTVSSSVVVGILSRNPSAGFRVFLLQCGIVTGIPAGAISAWLAHNFWQEYGESVAVLAAGGLAGAFAGVVLALML